MWWKQRRIYLDYAAATPVRPEVLKAMERYQRDDFGNAGAIHLEGQTAKRAVEAAREKVGRTLRVRPDDIIFTSGGTESNHLALRGAVAALAEVGALSDSLEIISLPTEHPSVSRTLEDLAAAGFGLSYAPVNEDGRLKLAEFKKMLSPKTRLVTMALANSETGVIQDIARIGRAIRAFERESGATVLFHVDASQAPRWLSCALDALFVDMMTLDAGKCEGPKGVGVLARRPRAKLAAVARGGAQEHGLRPGTVPTALVVGAAEAIALSQSEAPKLSLKVSALRDRWLAELLQIPGVILNGSREHRLPNNVNISIPGFDTEFAAVFLDSKGIAASTKSACSGADSGRSSVVYAMTGDDARATSTLRFTLTPRTTWKELQRTTKVLKEYLRLMKGLT